MPDGTRAICGEEGGITIVTLATNGIVKSLKYPRGNLQALIAAPDGVHAASGGNDGAILWWNLNTGTVEHTFDISDGITVNNLALSPDGKVVAAACSDGRVAVFSLADRRRLWINPAHPNGCTCVAFSRDGKQLASCGLDKTVAVWDAATGASVRRFTGHADLALSVVFLAKPGLLVSGGKDGSLIVWTVEAAQYVRKLQADAAIFCLLAGPGDKFLIAGGAGGMVQLIPMPALELEAIVKEPPPTEKLGMPDAEEIAAAAKALHELHQVEFANPSVEEQLMLADRLFTKAQAKATPAMRWALFREARELAVKNARLPLAFKIIETIEQWFDIDDLAEKATTLNGLILVAPASGQKELVDIGAKLLQQAEKERREDLAKPLFEALGQAAKKSGSSDLARWVESLQAKKTNEERLKVKLEELQAKLKEKPGDPMTRLELGLVLCSQNNWAEGLPHISKGADPKMGLIADADLAAPKSPIDQKDLGSKWLTLADMSQDWKLPLLLRAKYWLEQAKAGLSGGEKFDVITTLNQIEKKLEPLVAASLPKTPTGPVTPRPKKPETVVRKNFNTIRNEATTKGQWKIDGTSKQDGGNLALLENPVSMTSAFQLVDNWKVVMAVVGDGRTIEIEVNKQMISIRPTAGRRLTAIQVERRGRRLSWAWQDQGTSTPSTNSVTIADAEQGPSTMLIRMSGTPSPRRDDGLLFQSIAVNGSVRLEE